jgi:predicted porin
MKHSQTHTTFKPVALAAAILVTSMASTAFAEGAVDTAAEIAALKSELAQLRQLVNQNAGVQQTNATKLAKVEEKIATSFNEPSSTTGARPITARLGGVDVRLFGSFDTYVENQDTGAGVVNRLVSSGSGYSQLGFDAKKDLGDGLTAFGDVRLSYQLDNGKTNSTARTFNTGVVGLSKDKWGTLQVGRMGTQVGEVLSNFKLIRVGTGNFIYNPFTTLTHDNVLKYTSPTFSNFQFSLTDEFGETAGDASKGGGSSALLRYDNGKTLVLGGIFTSNAPTDIATAKDKITITSIGASHDFGFVKPFLVMQQATSDLSPKSLDQTGWYAGVDMPVGPGTLRLEYESVKNSAWSNADAHSANIRYDWMLSPGVMVYTTYTKIFNDSSVYYPIVGTGGFAAVPQLAAANPLNPTFNTSLNGASPTALGVGIKFEF